MECHQLGCCRTALQRSKINFPHGQKATFEPRRRGRTFPKPGVRGLFYESINPCALTNFIPIFPLGIVVFPGEQVNLHIFEPRYKQLIPECFADNKPFGIPVAIENKLADYGTLVRITEIKEVYEDGKMDIRILGENRFRVLEWIEKVPNKLYSGAIVTYPSGPPNLQPVLNQMETLLVMLRQLHNLLGVSKSFEQPDEQLRSYDIAHHAGLTLSQELELLKLDLEDQRQEYLRRHLQEVLPVVKQMEELKERVKLNGHFRSLKSFGF